MRGRWLHLSALLLLLVAVAQEDQQLALMEEGAGPPPAVVITAAPPDFPDGTPNKTPETILQLVGLSRAKNCGELQALFLDLLDSGSVFSRNQLCDMEGNRTDNSTDPDQSYFYVLSAVLPSIDVAIAALYNMGEDTGADLETFVQEAGVPCGSIIDALTIMETQERPTTYTFSCEGKQLSPNTDLRLAAPALCCDGVPRPPRRQAPPRPPPSAPALIPPGDTMPPVDQAPPLAPPQEPSAPPPPTWPSPYIRRVPPPRQSRPQLTLSVLVDPMQLSCTKLLSGMETIIVPYGLPQGTYTCARSNMSPRPPWMPEFDPTTLPPALLQSSGGVYMVVTAKWNYRQWNKAYRRMTATMETVIDWYTSITDIPCGNEIRVRILNPSGTLNREDVYGCGANLLGDYRSRLEEQGMQGPGPAPGYDVPGYSPDGMSPPFVNGGGSAVELPPAPPVGRPPEPIIYRTVGLSKGAIAVIITLSVAAMIITAAVVVFLYRRRRSGTQYALRKQAAGGDAGASAAEAGNGGGMGSGGPGDASPAGGAKGWAGLGGAVSKGEHGEYGRGMGGGGVELLPISSSMASTGSGLPGGELLPTRGSTPPGFGPAAKEAAARQLAGQLARYGSAGPIMLHSDGSAAVQAGAGEGGTGPWWAVSVPQLGMRHSAGPEGAALHPDPRMQLMLPHGDSVVVVRAVRTSASTGHQPHQGGPPRQWQHPEPQAQGQAQLGGGAVQAGSASPSGLGAPLPPLPPAGSFNGMNVFRDAANMVCLSNTNSAAPSGVGAAAGLDLRVSTPFAVGMAGSGSTPVHASNGPSASASPMAGLAAHQYQPSPHTPHSQASPGVEFAPGQAAPHTPRALVQPSPLYAGLSPPHVTKPMTAREVTLLDLFNASPLAGAVLATPPTSTGGAPPSPSAPSPGALGALVRASAASLGLSPLQLPASPGSALGPRSSSPAVVLERLSVQLAANIARLQSEMEAEASGPSFCGVSSAAAAGGTPTAYRAAAAAGGEARGTGLVNAGALGGPPPSVMAAGIELGAAAGVASAGHAAQQQVRLQRWRTFTAGLGNGFGLVRSKRRAPASPDGSPPRPGGGAAVRPAARASGASPEQGDGPKSAAAAGQGQGQGGSLQHVSSVGSGRVLSHQTSHQSTVSSDASTAVGGSERTLSPRASAPHHPGGALPPPAPAAHALPPAPSSAPAADALAPRAQAALLPHTPRYYQEGTPLAVRGPAPGPLAAGQATGPGHAGIDTTAGGGSGLASAAVPPPTPGTADLDLDISPKDLKIHTDGLLGAGAFGSVYRGSFQGQPVAIKVLHHLHLAVGGTPGQQLMQQKDVEAFRHEIAILSRLQHANIVRVLGGCAHPSHPFLVMELMPRCLHNVIHGVNTRLTLGEVLRIGRDVAAGLAHLHPAVVHRDLKPANILLDAAGTAKISDFGLARYHLKPYISTQQPDAGSVAYMAPEGFDPAIGRLSAKCDVYSFAVLLWEMLTQEHPWSGETNVSIIYRVAVHRMRLPLPQDPAVCPPRLAALLEQCFSYHPQDRPNMKHVFSELEQMLDQHQRGQPL